MTVVLILLGIAVIFESLQLAAHLKSKEDKKVFSKKVKKYLVV
jgi:hypothetical protein